MPKRKNHDGENWPYHENKRTHKMVPCASNPCTLHGGDDVMATSLEEAYVKRMAEKDNENKGLKKQLGMTSAQPAPVIPISIPSDEAEEILDEYVNRALEIGSHNASIANSPIMEGEEVIRLSDGSYIARDELNEDFHDANAFNRLAITMNDYNDSTDLHNHWNDDDWLKEHAESDMKRRALEGPDDITIGFSVVTMPSPKQWSDETGKDISEYPARASNENDTDYYKRGAAQLEKRAAKVSNDLTPEASHLYPDDDGTPEAAKAHRTANMLAWSNMGMKALVSKNPAMIWEHVDNDGIDHMNSRLDGDDRKIVNDVAWKTLSSDIEYSNDYADYTVSVSPKTNELTMMDDSGRVMLVSLDDNANRNGTAIRWSSWSTDAYDADVDKTGTPMRASLYGRDVELYPLSSSCPHGSAVSDGETGSSRNDLMKALHSDIIKLFG